MSAPIEERSGRRTRARAAGTFAALLFLALAGAPGHAPAQTGPGAPPAPPADMSVAITPALSTSANSVPWGWTTIVFSVTNSSASPARGEVRAVIRQYGEKRSFEAQAPYVAPAGATVSVRLPVDVIPYAQVNAFVVDAERGPIGTATFNGIDARNVVLFDTSGSQLKGAINDVPVQTLYEEPAHRGSGTTPTLGVVTPRVDTATGDPILPERAALYDAADAVLFRSDMLARLAGAELEALAGYVLAGGTLAVAITRPEDVRNPTITALVGGEIAQASVSSEALKPLLLPRPGGTSGERDVPFALAPGEELGTKLGGFRGGNLRGSAYGSSAPYGLGEVHLLAFDPTSRPALDDGWARVRVVDLARRAFDRRSQVVFRPGAGDSSSYDLEKVRRQLDPNESSRWAIALAAILLLAYAIIAGPVNYSIAARRNKPLSALRLLPIFSAIMFFVIVGIGMLAKGSSGRARHLSLIEAGAGMPKATIRRYRGFFASRAKELTVRTTDPTSVLRSAMVSEPGETVDKLVVDREGARLESVNALPWQTLVMREDGLADLGEGITILKKDASTVTVKNRSGHDLRAALLRLPTGEVRYFAKIEDGAAVESSAGRDVGSSPRDRSWLSGVNATRTVGGMAVHPLNAYSLGPILESDAPGLAEAWLAIEEASQRDAAWFLDDVPVLIAQMDGGEGRTSDAGLRLESDRLLVRVVGHGGTP